MVVQVHSRNRAGQWWLQVWGMLYLHLITQLHFDCNFGLIFVFIQNKLRGRAICFIQYQGEETWTWAASKFVSLQDFASFYPYYLCEHVKPRTKVFLHIREKNIQHWNQPLLQLFHFIATFNATAILGKLIFGRCLHFHVIFLPRGLRWLG